MIVLVISAKYGHNIESIGGLCMVEQLVYLDLSSMLPELLSLVETDTAPVPGYLSCGGKGMQWFCGLGPGFGGSLVAPVETL